MRKASKRLKRLGRAALAVAQWFLLSHRSRKNLFSKGISNWRDFVNVRLGLTLDKAESFIDWVERFGFGLVKDPTDVYELMSIRLNQEPDFAFVSGFYKGNGQSQTGTGFLVSRLPSGAWFYSCPFERGSTQATSWLYETSENMGFIPSWRAND